MDKSFVFVLLLMVLTMGSFAQSPDIDDAIATPSKEVYDLLQDQKGFIWMGDELGIRRYDGVSFTTFEHPAQSSLSMTNLVLDKQGRIWCNNFNGQVFYIEQERMHLLPAYKAADEKGFPYLALCGDELLATSYRGLFVCNTRTLQCRYIPVADRGLTSLCVVQDKAILYGHGSWFLYQAATGLSPLAISPAVKEAMMTNDVSNFTLQPDANRNTVYAICNPGSLLFTFVLDNNVLQLQSVNSYNSFINTVTIDSGQTWLHTKNESINLSNGKSIRGRNLSCMLSDSAGNTWYGSLDEGLQVDYGREPWENVTVPALQTTDFVRCIRRSNAYVVMGSQHGAVLVKDTGENTLQQYALPAEAGSVEHIGLFGGDNFLIAGSVGLYLLRPATGKLQRLTNAFIIKDIAYHHDTLYLATAKGLLMGRSDTANVLPHISFTPMFNKRERCRAVRYDAVTGALWIAYADGLYQGNHNRLEPVLYNGAPIYASSLEYINGTLYAGTYSGSLMAIQQDGINKFTFKKNNFGNAVLRMRRIGNQLWIINAFGMNIFDVANQTFLFNKSMLFLQENTVWDVAGYNGTLLLATTAHLYKLMTNAEAQVHPPPLYLRYLSVNNQDSFFTDHVRLSHAQNNLSFYFTTPWYNKNSQVTIRYQLVNTSVAGSNTGNWYYLANNDRVIQFNALAAGTYRLLVEAGINDSYDPNTAPLQYHFTIIKPWYSQWWFYVLAVASMVAATYLLYQYRVNQLLKMEKLRRKISSDLHDEVGSTVSSINIYSQLIKNGQRPADYIDMIQSNTLQVINSLDELVWNINPKFDTLEQLVDKMKLFAIPLLSDNNIACRFEVTMEKKNKLLTPEVRTHLYLVLKEAVNNVVKHAHCKRCNINVVQRGKLLTLHIKDDGQGFDVATAAQHRNGITGMQYRAQQLKARLKIVSAPGAGTEIVLLCKMNSGLKIT